MLSLVKSWFQVFHTIISSGKKLAERERSECPLMYEWHEKAYLGAAHGLVGIFYTLLLVRRPHTVNDRHLFLKSTKFCIKPFNIFHWLISLWHSYSEQVSPPVRLWNNLHQTKSAFTRVLPYIRLRNMPTKLTRFCWKSAWHQRFLLFDRQKCFIQFYACVMNTRICNYFRHNKCTICLKKGPWRNVKESVLICIPHLTSPILFGPSGP